MTSPVESSDLSGELARIRKNEGLLHPNLVRRIGPTLRLVCGIESTDDYAAVGNKIRSVISALAEDMDDKLFLVLKGELNMLSECKFANLGDRQGWLASQLNQEPPTIRKRGLGAISVAASLLADRYVEQSSLTALSLAGRKLPSAAIGNEGTREKYSVDRHVRTSFYKGNRLDSVHLQRTITSKVDGLDQMLTKFRWHRDFPQEAEFDHCLSCSVSDVRLSTSGMVEFAVNLPKKLLVGESHSYEYRARPSRSDHPSAEPRIIFWTIEFQPHLVFRAQFDKSCLPTVIWRIGGLNPLAAPGSPETCELMHVDSFGFVEAAFDNTLLGKAYGFAWKWPTEDAAPQAIVED